MALNRKHSLVTVQKLDRPDDAPKGMSAGEIKRRLADVPDDAQVVLSWPDPRGNGRIYTSPLDFILPQSAADELRRAGWVQCSIIVIRNGNR
jgi:hypothetical protein